MRNSRKETFRIYKKLDVPVWNMCDKRDKCKKNPRYPEESCFNKRINPFENGTVNSSSTLSGRFSSNRSYEDNEILERRVQEYFNKIYFFQPPLQNWSLPDPELMFSSEKEQIPCFQELKNELNNVKNKLNDYNLDEWHKHTRAMNKAGNIQWKLRKDFDPEFVTQAWCKFYESAECLPLVPPAAIHAGFLNSVHLCEAPGAFITSLNHYLKLNCKGIEWKWIATTLNPYYEGNPLSCMINDDRFILQTLSNWQFGEDFTGNLMDLTNMLHLAKEADKMGPVMLVTADGSIDCQEDPGEQECIVSALHFCEAVSALHILNEGGSFLLKMFTMFEIETICLMYLLCCTFNAVRVFKPATSKEGNSEVYVICLEYRGKAEIQPVLKKLQDKFGHVVSSISELASPLPMVPPTEIPLTPIMHIIACVLFEVLSSLEYNQDRLQYSNVLDHALHSADNESDDFSNVYMEHGERKCDRNFPIGPPSSSSTMFSTSSIPDDFIRQLYDCAVMFKNYQIDVIETNIAAFTKGRGSCNSMIKRLRCMISNYFMEHYQMGKIEEKDEVVGKRKLNETETLNLDPRTEEGSFNDRCKRKVLPPIEQLHWLEQDLNAMHITWPFKENVHWMRFPNDISGFSVKTGKPVKTVHSSKFCLGRLLKIRNQVRQLAKDILPTVSSPSCNSPSGCSVVAEAGNPLFSILEQIVPMSQETRILDFKEDLWSSMESGHNEIAELTAFKKILETIDGIWRDENLLIIGYPMLTQFNVGIIYMLSHMFKKVGFLKPVRQYFAVIFVGYLSWNKKISSFLHDVEAAFEEEEEKEEDRTVLAVLPISILCGKRLTVEHQKQRMQQETEEQLDVADTVFYECVTEVNHLCVKEQIIDIINQFK